MRKSIPVPGRPALGPISFGCSTFGREIQAETAFALLDYVVARGVVMLDTAATYSDGVSERILGEWLAARKPRKNELIIATKLYPPFTPENIAVSFAASAARLGRDSIDLFYLHKWDASAETPEALAALDRLVLSGKVRALGACNFTADQFARVLAMQHAAGLAPFRVVQNNHNLAVREADPPLRALCAREDVAIVTYSPLGAGFLTGKHRTGVQPGSRFALSPGHQDIYFNPLAQRRLDRLATVAGRTGLAMTHLALAWALHQPGTASVLVGGRGPEYLDQALAALPFCDRKIFDELEAD